MLLAPENLSGEVIRPLSTAALIRDRMQREEERDPLAPDLFEVGKGGGGMLSSLVPLEASFRVLGIVVDWFRDLDEYFASMLKKAHLRRGILYRAARCSWGLEWGVLKRTHGDVIASLPRYALRFAGSCLPTDLFSSAGKWKFGPKRKN